MEKGGTLTYLQSVHFSCYTYSLHTVLRTGEVCVCFLFKHSSLFSIRGKLLLAQELLYIFIGEFQIKILKKHVLIVVYSTCRYFLRLHIRLMYNVKKTNPKGKVIKKLFFYKFLICHQRTDIQRDNFPLYIVHFFYPHFIKEIFL